MKYTGLLSLAPFAVSAADQSLTELVAHLNTIPKTWTAGINNKFDASASPRQYAHLMGSLPINPEDDLPLREVPITMDIPESFDPRVTWGATCPSLYEIRDQGSCGSCWAFGAAEAFTDRSCIQSNGAETIDLSAEDILTCCHIKDGEMCGLGCFGGNMAFAWNYLAREGIVTGGLYEGVGCRPYSIPPCEHHTTGDRPDCDDMPFTPTPKCVQSCQDGSDYQSSKHVVSDSYRVGSPSNLEAFQQDLMTNGPLEVGFTVYEDFMTYTGGVYYHAEGQSLGGHAVKLMGWGVDADTGMDYWLLANSWNSDWAEDGFFRVRRGTNECGLENGGYGGMI